MDWKEAAEEAVEDIREDGIIGGTKDLRQEYRLDQRELGKIIFISSLALFVTSAPAALTLQDTYNTVESANDDLNQVQGIITSDGFQRNLEVMNERVSGDLGTTIEQVYRGMQRTNQSLQRLESTERQLQDQSENYKWMSLLSIMGMVAGIVTIYV
jgi:hypothetical protein